VSRYDRLMMFRAAALQGILACPNTAEGAVFKDMAVWACKAADAMMAECDKRDREAKDR